MDKLINADNKQYRFNPGKNGSLTVVSKSQQPQQDLFNRPRVSKVVPALKAMRKGKYAAQTAAVRG